MILKPIQITKPPPANIIMIFNHILDIIIAPNPQNADKANDASAIQITDATKNALAKRLDNALLNINTFCIPIGATKLNPINIPFNNTNILNKLLLILSKNTLFTVDYSCIMK